MIKLDIKPHIHVSCICLFSLHADVVWCPTWSKNLGRSSLAPAALLLQEEKQDWIFQTFMHPLPRIPYLPRKRNWYCSELASKSQNSHCYFTKLNPKRISHFYFCLLVLLGIHRNPKQKFFGTSEGFLGVRTNRTWPVWEITKVALFNPCM